MSTVRCSYCGKDLLASVDNYISWQTDYIVPHAKGGSDDPYNLTDCCWQCNHIKAAWDPREKADENADKEELIEAGRTEMEVWRAGYKQACKDKLRRLQAHDL